MTLDGEAGVSIITDHRFRSPIEQPWGLCIVPGCGLGEAAHSAAEGIYTPVRAYRCPYCVNVGEAVCTHLEAPLGMDGRPL